MNLVVKRTIFDAHLHIIDPRFPLHPHRGFVPDPFDVNAYRRAVEGLDLVGGAVVAGSMPIRLPPKAVRRRLHHLSHMAVSARSPSYSLLQMNSAPRTAAARIPSNANPRSPRVFWELTG